MAKWDYSEVQKEIGLVRDNYMEQLTELDHNRNVQINSILLEAGWTQEELDQEFKRLVTEYFQYRGQEGKLTNG